MITLFSDHVVSDINRLPTADIRELQIQMNCNHDDSEDMETWFDEEIPVGYTETIDEDEFFNRYFGETYDC